MVLTPQQRAVQRAKKAMANGNTNFRPRGEKNKAAFEALKEHAPEAQNPPTKRMKITTASSSHTSNLASLLDFKPEHITDTSDEEEEERAEEQDDARIAKIKAHREQIKKREEHMKNELSKQEASSAEYAVRLPPKTKAQLLVEQQEDIKRESRRLSMQIFKLANQLKQLDVLHSYKTFEKQEHLLEWLQDLLEQKQAGFHIEDDDSREAAWQKEKQDRERKGLHTNMSDHKAKKIFFESNEFLMQPLQISLLKKDICGKLTEDEKSKLGLQVLQIKAELKQEKHPELSEKPVGMQLYCLQVLKNNKKRLQERGMWEDDSTRELKMKQEGEFQKQAEEIFQKLWKDGNNKMISFLEGPSTVTIEEIEDSQPMLALENSTPAITMEAETYSEDETDVEEPPPCPVHLMR